MQPFISAACGVAGKGGEQQNADEISSCASGNEIPEAQISVLKTTMLQISGRFGVGSNPTAVARQAGGVQVLLTGFGSLVLGVTVDSIAMGSY